MTITKYPHEYNITGPAAYFITFNTYGTWLHGDDRGSADRKVHNIPGTPVLTADSVIQEKERSRLKNPPITLNREQRRIIESTIREVIEYNQWRLHAINVRTEHIHVVLTAGAQKPEFIMNRFKSWCTRALRESGLLGNEITLWSRHGSTRYLWSENDVHEVVKYVLYRQ
jgi:REP element-mobilizing transposase RayT